MQQSFFTSLWILTSGHSVCLPPFQNGLVLNQAEMFKLKSCIRRKTDSIDKRFCFDIEVVERFVRDAASVNASHKVSERLRGLKTNP